MKNMIIVYIILCSAIFQACFNGNFEEHEINKVHSEIGKVFYIPFDIDFATGIPESQFESLSYCNAKIDIKDFMKLLVVTGDLYPMGDPRAKIIFKDNLYYISREGIVTDFRNTYVLKSKSEFYNLIKNSLDFNPTRKSLSKNDTDLCT